MEFMLITIIQLVFAMFVAMKMLQAHLMNVEIKYINVITQIYLTYLIAIHLKLEIIC